MKLGIKRGPKPKGKRAMTGTERSRKSRAEYKDSKYRTVAEEIAASKSAPVEFKKP
jgi:hypothetical protein